MFPALVIFISRWFARSERSLANSFVTLSTPVTVLWMSIVSGYLVQAFGWRWMFVIEGAAGQLVGVRLVGAGAGSARRRGVAAAGGARGHRGTIAAEQGAIKPVRDYGEAFRSPVVIRMTVLYFFWGLSLFGFVLWLPTIIKEANAANIVRTGWLSAGPYLLAAIAMPIVSLMSDRIRDRRHVVLPCLAVSAIAFLTLYCDARRELLDVLRVAVPGRDRSDHRARAVLRDSRGHSSEKCGGRRRRADQQRRRARRVRSGRISSDGSTASRTTRRRRSC